MHAEQRDLEERLADAEARLDVTVWTRALRILLLKWWEPKPSHVLVGPTLFEALADHLNERDYRLTSYAYREERRIGIQAHGIPIVECVELVPA